MLLKPPYSVRFCRTPPSSSAPTNHRSASVANHRACRIPPSSSRTGGSLSNRRVVRRRAAVRSQTTEQQCFCRKPPASLSNRRAVWFCLKPPGKVRFCRRVRQCEPPSRVPPQALGVGLLRDSMANTEPNTGFKLSPVNGSALYG